MARRDLLISFACSVLLAAPAFAQVVVTNANLQGWTLTASSGTGDDPPPATFLAPGFETPPLGDGSVHFHVGEDGNDASQARTNNFSGTRIDAITDLSYGTFVHIGSGNQAPYLLFSVDTDGDLGTADVELWFFEPLYQSAAFFPSNPQGPLTTDTWQMWDARNGGWYTQSGLAGSGPGANVKSIDDILAVAPNATIVSSGSGGVRIVTGFGAGPWDNFVGATDNFRFATASSDVTYDFEPDSTTFVTVTPSSLEEWTLMTVDQGVPGGSPSSTIVTGPGTPPLPPGSLRLEVGTDGADAAEARSDRWDGLLLRDLAALTYDSYHESGGSGGQMPYLLLRADYDNDGDQDDLLFFEPAYQTAGFCPSNPQPAVATGTWQSWKAIEGCWWSVFGTAGATPGAGVKPLATIIAAEPDARFVTGATGGSFRIVAGFGAGAWDDFIGYVDNVNVALNPIADTTYDFDPDPTIIIDDLAANEGDAGTTPFTFDLTLSHAVSYSVTVQYSTADGTATVADNDYVAQAAQTVTFDPNTTSATLTIDVNGDTKFETDQTFFVDLSSPSGATIADAQAQGTITNDDEQPTISIADVTLAEGDAGTTNFVFNVMLSNASDETVTVDFTTADDSAIAPDDYATTAGTLTFDPGVTLRMITVPVVGETTFETDEAFFVNLSDPGNATIFDGQGIGTITNDDTQPEISIEDVTLAEGDAGTTDFVLNVTLSNASASTITVDFTTNDDTALAPGDYATTAGTVTFDPGVTSRTITVSVVGETTFETDETFFVDLSDPTNATIADAQALATITNDDAQPSISIEDVTLAEGDAGTTDFVFNVTLSNSSASTITVDFTTTDDTATAPADYSATSGTLTFDPGETLQTITVPVIGETTFETDETFTVDLSDATNAGIADNQALGTITNDDTQPAISIEDVTLAEGDAGTTDFVFDVTLSNASASAITVDFATANDTADTADYASNSGTLTFSPGVTLQTITVSVNGDTTFESDETFFVDLTDPSNATIADAQGLGTITNDDPQPTISIDDVTLAEGDAGTTNFVFNVTLSNPSASTITVDYATADGTAAAPGDYTSTSGTLTFDPGITSRSITVPAIGETTFESDETFFVNLTDETNATIAESQGTGTITNDDAQPTISIEDVTLAEGNAGTTGFVFDVTLSNPSASTITVDFATANDTADATDYTATSGTLTFNPGVTLQTITVAVNGDTTFESDETFFVDLTDPSNATIADARGLGTIQNDEGVPTLSITDVTLAEGDAGTTDFAFEVTLSAPSASTITVDYTTADDTAAAPGDYATISGTLTFDPGETTQTITVAVSGDTTFEADETFFVDLSNISGAAFADNQGLGTITNDDGQPAISIDDVTLAEGDAGATDFVFNVTLSNASQTTVTVDYATADDSATAPSDYATTSGTLTFAPGVTAMTITVSVNGDTTFEADETFFADLTNPSGATLADDQGLGTITNDDPQPSITIGDVTLAEGDTGTTNFVFDVTLSNPSASTITVDFATADNTAIAPGDYVATAGTLTFDPGVTTQSITVGVVGDMTFEAGETFFVNLTNPGGAGIADDRGLGTILNDDTQPTITIGDVALAEGDAATTTFAFDVTLSNPSAGTVTVDFATADGTAIAPGDYAATAGTVTFDPGVTARMITVAVAGDTTFENDETFFVNLTDPSGATIADDQGLGTIQNDEGVPTMSVSDVTLAEGNGGTTSFVFNVTLSAPSASAITVDYATADDTAIAPVDYTATSGTLTFDPGVTALAITVPVNGDTTFEADETFFVDLTNPSGAAFADDQGLGTITNDDGQPSISIGDVTLAEGNGGTTNFVFDVTLSGPSASAITVDFATADNTATAPSDYAPAAGTLTFDPGVLLQTITVVVTGDTTFESTETFFVNLSNPSGATIGDGQGLGTITTDDGPVADLTITKTGPANVQTGAPINYTITVTNNGPQAATDVVVTDILPSGTTFVSANPSQGTCSGTTTVTCDLGTLDDGATATIELIVNAPDEPGPLSNTATATSNESDPTPPASTAVTFAAGAAAGANIPTLSEWALLALLMALVAAAAARLQA